jgi:hypothetical protein
MKSAAPWCRLDNPASVSLSLVLEIGTFSKSLLLAPGQLGRGALVMVNLPTAGLDYHVPFGGRTASNYGPCEQGRYATEFYAS